MKVALARTCIESEIVQRDSHRVEGMKKNREGGTRLAVQLVQFALNDLEHEFVRDEACEENHPGRDEDEKRTMSCVDTRTKVEVSYQ